VKVAVVYPEVYDLARFREKRKEFPPFGVLYLSAVLENANVDVRMFKVSPENTSLDLRGFDAIAFSIPSSATYGLIKDSRFGSLYSEDSLLMVGGVHPNFYPEETLLDIQPHVVGIGEGEATILELLQECHTRRFSRVKGVCYFEGGTPTRTSPRTLIPDIDTLPLPARHLLDQSDFVMQDRLSNTDLRMAHVMFSRGCPFPCRFCAAAQTKIQYRSGESARRELVHLINTYGIEGFAIVDDNFIVNKRKVRDICFSIQDLNLKWSALSRVDTVDEGLLRDMTASGCIEIKFGMESGSESILKAMRKNITPEQIENTVRKTYTLGINVKLFVIHGYPGENAETTNETISLLEKIAPMIERVSLFRFVPLPGTYVYDHPHEFDLHGTNRDADWDGDWSKYHIHHNNYHWWGSKDTFEIVTDAYEKLDTFVKNRWPDKHDQKGPTILTSL
jgi:radical SAM superfamily enzyme YgiQ (UPF0313 family)